MLRTIKWPGDETVAELRALNDAMSALVDAPGWLDIVDLNHRFHALVWSQSTQNLIRAEVERIWPLADAYVARGYSSPRNRAEAIRYHERIIEALAARDPLQLQEVSAAHRRSTVRGAEPTFV